MAVSSVWLATILFFLSYSVIRAQRPSEGAALFLRDGSNFSPLPNISLISPLEVGSSQAVVCGSALRVDADIGDWFTPDGSQVRRLTAGEPLYVTQRINSVELNRQSSFTSAMEGIYTCRIPDENNVIQSLLVGIYTAESLQNASPQFESPIIHTIVSIAPVSFTLSWTSSGFPPTTVVWTRNSVALSSGVSRLLDARTSRFHNVLEVSGALGGTYKCSVNNSRGSNSLETVLRVPLRSPSDVEVRRIGNNQVRVTWTPPISVTRYVITYETDFIVANVTIESGAATQAVLSDLETGVEYRIRVQAFVELPGPVSQAVAIMLTAPPPPSISTVVSPTPTSIRIEWESVDTAMGYTVVYTPGAEACERVEGGSETVIGEQTTSHTLLGLEEFTEYVIELRSNGMDGMGMRSDPVSVATLPGAPAPPTVTSVVGRNGMNGFTITWEEPVCEDINSESIRHYVVRYGRPGNGQGLLIEAPSSPFTFSDDSLVALVDYEIEVATVNTLTIGSYSAPARAVILQGPGLVSFLRVSPDITSIFVTWEPPSVEMGRAYITQYEVIHRLSVPGANPIRQTRLSNTTFSFQISNLLPEVIYEVTVRGLIEEFEGEGFVSTLRTLQIGPVFGIAVIPLDATTVQLTWMPIRSQDIAGYRVYYTLQDSVVRQQEVETTSVIDLPPNANSTQLDGLVAGAEYLFEMVGVVIVNGMRHEGERSNGSTILLGGESSVGVPPLGIAGIVVGVVFILLLVLILLFVLLLIWRRSTSGRYIVKKTKDNHEVTKSSSTTMPLPDFEPFIPTSKPTIERHPPDTTAMEGQRVILKPKVLGSPLPTVAWYRDGDMVTSDYAVEVQEDGTLLFVCVEQKHSGTYKFTVSNSAGSIQGKVKLSVFSEEDWRNKGLDADDFLLTSKIQVHAFGQYVQELHAHSNKGFREQFYRLPNREDGHTVNYAQRPNHKGLNRFTNITVYDDNRVILKPLGNILSCQHDYINACHVNGYFTSKKFVVTQGPTDNTIIDFWRMVWQLRTPTIVMITNLTEAGRAKCTQYWPDSESDTADYGPFRVFLSGESVYGNYIIRTLHLNLTLKTQSPLKVIQYHFTSWPDHGIPDYVAPMLAFHRRIKAEHKSMLGPMLVHCSAGVGRSGTFITLDIALQQASGEECVDIPAIISNLRNQRMKMVQTQDQYIFIHDAILESLVCGNTQIPAHDLKRSIELLSRRDPHTGLSGFQSLFKVLEQVSPKPEEVTSATAKKNISKNRYDKYLPVDRYRVVLKTEHPDYINATFVDGYKERKKFIIAQSPLPNTTRDFWKMVYERNSGSIVMLCGMVEDEEDVCHKYWPTRGIEQYGEYDVSLMEQTMHDGFLERIYSVTDSKSGQAHRVTQFQVISWDPQGVLFNLMAILNIIHRVTMLQKNSNTGPIVVHCSDTVTRSGIFCAVCNAIECCKVEKTVDIFQVVKVLRNQRPGAIPTVEHYRIIHDILLYHVQNVPDY